MRRGAGGRQGGHRGEHGDPLPPPAPGATTRPARFVPGASGGASPIVRVRRGERRNGNEPLANRMRNLTGRATVSGPEIEADLAMVQLQPRLERPPGLGLEALELRAAALTQERLGRAGTDPLAGDRLPDGELAPAPPSAAAVGPLPLGDLRAAEGTGAEHARGRPGRAFGPG